jgi:hypothetical protein
VVAIPSKSELKFEASERADASGKLEWSFNGDIPNIAAHDAVFGCAPSDVMWFIRNLWTSAAEAGKQAARLKSRKRLE